MGGNQGLTTSGMGQGFAGCGCHGSCHGGGQKEGLERGLQRAHPKARHGLRHFPRDNSEARWIKSRKPLTFSASHPYCPQGRVTVNVDPFPTSLSTSTVPTS